MITGPTGVLGTALTKKMAEMEIETYVMCHPGSKRTATILNSPFIHKVECDLSDMQSLPIKIGGKCDAFFHLAWLGTENPKNRFNMYLQNKNIQYTLDAVEIAKILECQVFVGAGSQAEYGKVDGIIHPNTIANPISGYGMAKLCAGQMTRLMCKIYGIRHIWPRVVSTYGINDSPNTLISVVIDQLLRGEKPSLTAGDQVWDYLYAADAAEAFYQMAAKGKDGAVYVLGSGQTKLLRDFMGIIRDEINPLLPLGLGEIPYYPDQAMHLEANIALLTRDTGWLPQTNFRDGISALIAVKKNKNKQEV